MSAELDALKAAIAHNTAVTANAVSVIAEFRNANVALTDSNVALTAQIVALTAQVADLQSAAADVAALTDLTSQVAADDAALDAAAAPPVPATAP